MSHITWAMYKDQRGFQLKSAYCNGSNLATTMLVIDDEDKLYL